MTRKSVVWSNPAEIEFLEIAAFYRNRNKSNSYSLKLYSLFKKALKGALKNPEAGLATKKDDIRGVLVGDYILFYLIHHKGIIVLKVWDCRQNPSRLTLKRI